MPITNLYDVQVKILKDSLIPEDAVTNTFHFVRTDLAAWSAADFAVVKGWLTTFYTTLGPSMSNDLNTGAPFQVKAYNQGDNKPRAPAFEDSFSPTGSWGGTASADELAVVLSFQAAKVSGIPQARRRGRLYIGPIVGGQGARPSSTVVNNVKLAGQGLMNSSILHATMRWCVYSPTSNGFGYVASGWVDDAWDVQRRRGLKAISRNTF